MSYLDKDDKKLKLYDVVDIKQTVNGEHLFVVIRMDPLTFVYGREMNLLYEYEAKDLVQFREFQIVGNISNYITIVRARNPLKH